MGLGKFNKSCKQHGVYVTVLFWSTLSLVWRATWYLWAAGGGLTFSIAFLQTALLFPSRVLFLYVQREPKQRERCMRWRNASHFFWHQSLLIIHPPYLKICFSISLASNDRSKKFSLFFSQEPRCSSEWFHSIKPTPRGKCHGRCRFLQNLSSQFPLLLQWLDGFLIWKVLS